MALTALVFLSMPVIYSCKALQVEKAEPVKEEAVPEVRPKAEPPEGTPFMSHELEGYEDCSGCHYEGGSDEGAPIVDKQHYCSACHEMAHPFDFDHGAPPNDSCTLCHRPE